MKTQNLYNKKQDCCGCEICVNSCPKEIIKLQEDEEGFMYPYIEDENLCLDCGKCIKVCPMKSSGRSQVSISKSFSFSLLENNDLQRSASGGLATAISREFINLGGKVYGVAYTDDCLAIKYHRADKLEDLEKFRGSKYAQSYKYDIYSKIREDLQMKNKVLFIGLPCEVSAVYHAIRNQENLYTISLICHGPTSQKVHRDFCTDLIDKYKSEIESFSVRFKLHGWKPYYIRAMFKNGVEYLKPFNQTDYNTAFLYLKRPSCRHCRYKYGDEEFGLQSDMTIGDFHGVDKFSEHYNSWGVSQGSVQTDKGNFLLRLLHTNTTPVIPFSKIRGSNRALFQSIPQRGNIDRFVRDYNKHSLHYACNSLSVRFTNFRLDTVSKLALLLLVYKIPYKIIEVIKKKIK